MVKRHEAKNISEDQGPWMWRNAGMEKEGSPSIGALEIGFFVDSYRAPIAGTAGPVCLMDPLYQIPLSGEFHHHGHITYPLMRLVGRVEQYIPPDEPSYDYVDDSWAQTERAVYHGGDASDELAALVSLAAGRRVRSAGIIRVFDPEGDPRGEPHQSRRQVPCSPFPPYSSRVLPYSDAPMGATNARALELIDLYSSLTRLEAVALVRAARSYQEALWIAEDDPRQAWLRLVSAAEAIAQLSSDLPAASRLKRAFTETESSVMVERLLATGDDELIEWAARRLADQGKATKKFLEFLLQYQPPQPPKRPTMEVARADWSKLRKQLRRIYECRSSDLHAGIPFPEFMCQAAVADSEKTRL